MFAVLLLAALCIASTYAACDAAGVSKCSDPFTTCLQGVGADTTKACTCYGTYLSCLGSAGCDVKTYVDSCKAAYSGCACSSASSVTMGAAAVIVAMIARFL